MFCKRFASTQLLKGYKIPIKWAFLGANWILFLLLRAESLRKFHEDFSSVEFVLDYEIGIQYLARIHLPSTEQLGCCFHYKQCVFGKIQNLGLVNQYKESPTFQSTVQKFSLSRFYHLAWFFNFLKKFGSIRKINSCSNLFQLIFQSVENQCI